MAPSRRDRRGPTPVKEESEDEDAPSLPLPNTIAPIIHSDLLQLPPQIPLPNTTRPKKGGSKPGQHRSKFTLEKGKETADTRKAGACDGCKRKKARCQPNHRNPPVEPPVQVSKLGQRNVVPRKPVHSYSVDEYLTNPADARPLIGGFKPLPNRPDIRVGSFDADPSASYYEPRSNVSIAPAHRDRTSSNAHSANRSRNNAHPYTRSDPPGQGATSRRLAARRNDPQQRLRNSSGSINQQPRPARIEQGDTQRPRNQTLQLPSARVASRSLPPGPDFTSTNSFLREPSPPPHDALYGPYLVQFDYMEGGSMTANLPSMHDGHPSNSTLSPHGFIPPGYNLSPFTAPNSQAQTHDQHYGTQPVTNHQDMTNYNHNASQQNPVSLNIPPNEPFDNQAQPYVQEFGLPSQHDFDMINDMVHDMIDNDLSDHEMDSSFNDPPHATDMGYDDNNTNNITNNLYPNTISQSAFHNEPYNPYNYQIPPLLEPADWSFPSQNDFTNEQPLHDATFPTGMTYDNTYISSFGSPGNPPRFEERPPLPIRNRNTGGMMENMENFDLNSVYGSFEEETRGL